MLERNVMAESVSRLCAGVLSQLLIYDETGCPHSARHAIRLLDQLSNFEPLDENLRQLCERACTRLIQKLN